MSEFRDSANGASEEDEGKDKGRARGRDVDEHRSAEVRAERDARFLSHVIESAHVSVILCLLLQCAICHHQTYRQLPSSLLQLYEALFP